MKLKSFPLPHCLLPISLLFPRSRDVLCSAMLIFLKKSSQRDRGMCVCVCVCVCVFIGRRWLSSKFKQLFSKFDCSQEVAKLYGLNRAVGVHNQICYLHKKQHPLNIYLSV